jgi:hypothetical protein
MKKRQLNNSMDNSEVCLHMDELENVIKHTPSFTKTAFPHPIQRNHLRKCGTLQTMSPNVTKVKLPIENSSESDDCTPSSQNIFEEGSANKVKGELRNRMVVLDITVA